ncbi:hypothetical protein ACVWZA_001624 [Sphingomonas sp. UYAg733]
MRPAFASLTILAAALPATVAAQPQIPQVVPLTATAPDGTVLSGEIDLPSGRAPRSVVLLVPGTGGFDRNVKFGMSGTPDDLIFQRLAQALTDAGLAVIRFDERGRSCGEGAGPPGPTGCSNPGLMGGITPETKAGDLVAIATAAMRARELKNVCLTVFAHSEGMLTVARAVESGSLQPAGIVGMGALLDSPASSIWWQMVHRYADTMKSMDADKDGVVTNDEIAAGWRKSPLGIYPAQPGSLNPTGRRTIAELDAAAQKAAGDYAKVRADALAHKDGDPYGPPGQPVASYRWWKQWFTDWQPVAARLAAFDGPMTLLYGSIDSQAPAVPQIAAAQDYLIHARLNTLVLPDLGHTLGTHPLLGPVDASALEQIVQATLNTAGACEKSGSTKEKPSS